MIHALNLVSKLYSLMRHTSTNVTREEIVNFRNERLRQLIHHAYGKVNYYRKLFDQKGLKPSEIQSVADLPAIPITSKKDLQSLPAEDVTASGVDPESLIVRNTTGSTGEPFTIRRTWFEERLLNIFRRRAMHDLGVRSLDKTASVDLARPTHPQDHQFAQKIIQSLGLYRKVHINCLLPPEDIIRKLRSVRPDVLMGFSGVISLLASIMSNEDRLLISPRIVAVGGDVLTPFMRNQITDTFMAPVFELYGSHEFNLIAWECKETGQLHTCDDNVIVEILKDGRPAGSGERGEVVGTNLHSFAMPFIRYRLGDIVIKGSETCLCGQPFSTMHAVQGRMIDHFLLPQGRILHPYEIVAIFWQEARNWIRQYQLIQEKRDRIILRVVPFTTPTPKEIGRLEGSVRIIVGKQVEFEVILVSEIKPEPNGKFRVSRSLVKSFYDEIDWDQQQIQEPYSGHR
jgi:phenylacetate-CoA ligase